MLRRSLLISLLGLFGPACYAANAQPAPAAVATSSAPTVPSAQVPATASNTAAPANAVSGKVGAPVPSAPTVNIVNVAPAAPANTVSGNVASGRIVSANAAASQAVAVVAEEPAAPPVPKKRKPRPVLPGVEFQGAKLNTKLTRANVISVSGDGTEIALVSAKFPNRIATPFAHPKIIDASSVVMQIDGSNIFLSPKSEKPFAIYITGDTPGDQVVSLTLEPKDIPAQTLILQLDSSGTSKRAAKPESYTQQLVDLLRQVGSGRVPEGYSEGRMPNMMAKQEGLTILPEVRYSGSWLDIYRYKVENNQSVTIELSETQFYQKGVKAVAILPNVILREGESSTVYVVADKSVLEQADSNGK